MTKESLTFDHALYEANFHFKRQHWKFVSHMISSEKPAKAYQAQIRSKTVTAV